MYKAGYRTLKDIVNADPLKLVSSIDHLPRRVAYEIVAAAKVKKINSILMKMFIIQKTIELIFIFTLTAFIITRSRNITRRS